YNDHDHSLVYATDRREDGRREIWKIDLETLEKSLLVPSGPVEPLVGYHNPLVLDDGRLVYAKPTFKDGMKTEIFVFDPKERTSRMGKDHDGSSKTNSHKMKLNYDRSKILTFWFDDIMSDFLSVSSYDLSNGRQTLIFAAKRWEREFGRIMYPGSPSRDSLL